MRTHVRMHGRRFAALADLLALVLLSRALGQLQLGLSVSLVLHAHAVDSRLNGRRCRRRGSAGGPHGAGSSSVRARARACHRGLIMPWRGRVSPSSVHVHAQVWPRAKAKSCMHALLGLPGASSGCARTQGRGRGRAAERATAVSRCCKPAGQGGAHAVVHHYVASRLLRHAAGRVGQSSQRGRKQVAKVGSAVRQQGVPAPTFNEGAIGLGSPGLLHLAQRFHLLPPLLGIPYKSVARRRVTIAPVPCRHKTQGNPCTRQHMPAHVNKTKHSCTCACIVGAWPMADHEFGTWWHAHGNTQVQHQCACGAAHIRARIGRGKVTATCVDFARPRDVETHRRGAFGWAPTLPSEPDMQRPWWCACGTYFSASLRSRSRILARLTAAASCARS